MADWAKIAIKTGLIAGIMAGIWALFTQVPVPVLDFTPITRYGSIAMAILNYWIPSFPIIWGITVFALGLLIILWTFRFSMIAVRWLFKVNE